MQTSSALTTLILIIISCHSNMAAAVNASAIMPKSSIVAGNTAIRTAVAVQAADNSLTHDYARMLEDAKWFFQRLAALASMVEDFLPEVAPMDKSKSLEEDTTRLHLLRGLRHLLVGIKEISLTVQQSFDTSHVRHLQQLKHARFFVQDLVHILKNWFAYLRRTLVDLLRLYNYYTPEVLLGKCLGRYLTTTYPERAIYEYPLLLLREVLNAAWTGATRLLPTDVDHTGTAQVSVLAPHEQQAQQEAAQPKEENNDLEMQQNEIPYHEAIALVASEADESAAARQTRQTSTAAGISSISIEPLMPADEDEPHQQTWQKCFQLFTAESVMRQLKLYFLQS